MLRTCILSLAAALLALPAAVGEDKGDKAAHLLGKYTVVSGKRDKHDLPKKDFEDSVVVFEKGKVYGHDNNKKEFFGATYKLDTSSKPWKITMVSTSPKKGEEADGVIEVDGDTVRLAYALPGGKTPTGFEAGEKQQSFVLKRMKK